MTTRASATYAATIREQVEAVATLHQPAPGTYFTQPGALEGRFTEPVVCPAFERVTLDGLAMTPTGALFLVLTVPGARAHFGPTVREVNRAAALLAVALIDSGTPRPQAFDTAAWILTLWAALAVESAAALDDLDPNRIDPTHPREPTSPDAIQDGAARAILAALTTTAYPGRF